MQVNPLTAFFKWELSLIQYLTLPFVGTGKYSTIREGIEIGAGTLSKDLIEFYQIQFQTTAQTQPNFRFTIANGDMISLTPSILLRPYRCLSVLQSTI